ncbi:molecular chaperone DjiA [Jannaschia formosa]|uniref:molecular chaperone DjiA n=1 Tax=Jannaschia formosa TaxID=2259592 RepID=UPI000E1C3618|nr:molecular chaperone DjiA [Jannaschia formosa]TFL17673.1 molecular chaperone DjiA [Jannaschia formosa]
MTLWQRILEALARLAPGERLLSLFDRLRTPPERSVAFTIAVIALGAKMAKADGQVTRAEVAAFREVFLIPKGEEDNAARVFDLARTDVAGFEAYATRIAAMFESDRAVLLDLMEGLFHIAVADGAYHPAEDAFLTRVAEIFGLEERVFRSLRARLVPGRDPDCWEVLGVEHGAPMEEVRAAWRALVRETHPDRMVARGLPEEAVKLAEKRLVAVNRAWERIQAGTA